MNEKENTFCRCSSHRWGKEGKERGGVENNTFISLLAFLQILINNMGTLLITEKEKSLDLFDQVHIYHQRKKKIKPNVAEIRLI